MMVLLCHFHEKHPEIQFTLELEMSKISFLEATITNKDGALT